MLKKRALFPFFLTFVQLPGKPLAVRTKMKKKNFLGKKNKENKRKYLLKPKNLLQ